MELAALRARVASEMRARADQLGLAAGSIEVEFVLNWGGFVNQSFRIDDGKRRLHLKLSDDRASVVGLERWYRIHTELTERYHAPPALGWIAVAGTILFRHIEGTPLATWNGGIRAQIALVLEALHADRGLRDRVAMGFRTSCRLEYHRDFHRRFTEDLSFVSERPPRFVTSATLDWMAREAGRLAGLVDRSAAFAEAANALIHGDLWPNNVVQGLDGSWHLLDWDDLRLGDPILDLAKLLDTGPAGGEPASPDEIAAIVRDDPAHRERGALRPGDPARLGHRPAVRLC
jgi:aminoglycoside phosphotransferase (APT) family kinase protein